MVNTANVLEFRPRQARVDETVETVTVQAPHDVALERYPEFSGMIGRLRRCGVRRVYGFFAASAWRETCARADLYSLPLDRLAMADLSKIEASAQKLAHSLGDHSWALGSPTPHIMRTMITAHGKAGDLAGLIFPNHGEASRGDLVTVEFPQPPEEFLPAIIGARLAGLEVGAAMPATAICNVELAGQTKASREMQEAMRALMAQYDPIIYGRDANQVAVLGHYNASDNDSPHLKALVASLTAISVDL